MNADLQWRYQTDARFHHLVDTLIVAVDGEQASVEDLLLAAALAAVLCSRHLGNTGVTRQGPGPVRT